MSTSSPHYTGHRARLRERFLKSGIDSLADYEVIEMLLFASNPRGDLKPLAKKLLEKFGTIGAVLHADPRELQKVEGIKEAAIAGLKRHPRVGQHLLKHQAKERPVIHTWRNVLDYCFASMSHLKVEQFRVLFLDRKNQLIEDEVQQVGTVDQTPVYPREVTRRALEIGASSLIMVHNHPSGDPLHPMRISGSLKRFNLRWRRSISPFMTIYHRQRTTHIAQGRRPHYVRL